jgi:hypothetical protein
LNSKPLAALALGAALAIAPVHTSDHHVANVVTGGMDIPAPAAPAVISASAYSAVSAYGGRTLIQARVNTAVTSCRLKLLSHQSFRVTYNTAPKRCHVNFYAYVTIAANPTHVYRSVAFEVIGLNAWGQFSRGMVYLNVAPKGSTYHMPPPPVVNTAQAPPPPPVIKAVQPKPPASPVPFASSTMPVNFDTSDNWSGYSLDGSNFTSVSGTFTAGVLTEGVPTSALMDEWVGIDGDGLHGNSNNDLIQAGIMESPVPCYGSQTYPYEPYNSNDFYICPWTFLIEDGSTSQGPVPQLTISENDSVSVDIHPVAGFDNWDITMTDNTSGQAWSTDVTYSGYLTSAEWIIEAPTNSDGSIATLASYQGVSFSNLRVNGNAQIDNVNDIALTLGGSDYISEPSGETTLGELISQGFTGNYYGP